MKLPRGVDGIELAALANLTVIGFTHAGPMDVYTAD